jgi:hypothetical protein
VISSGQTVRLVISSSNTWSTEGRAIPARTVVQKFAVHASDSAQLFIAPAVNVTEALH